MKTLPAFKKGDTVKVSQKVIEGKKERIVTFKGKVIGVKGRGANKMFTVRQAIEGVNVDRIYPFLSPTIAKIEVV